MFYPTEDQLNGKENTLYQLKQSGLGVGGIPHTMQDMQIEKLMVLRSKEL